MKKILVDTSVWINHFKIQNETLTELLKKRVVRTHPLVIGEIACGTPSERKLILAMLHKLEQVKHASDSNVLTLIENEKLYGHGCRIVDITILASCLITPETEIWTIDKRLKALAERFNVMHQPTLH